MILHKSYKEPHAFRDRERERERERETSIIQDEVGYCFLVKQYNTMKFQISTTLIKDK
jgi:hypothetical protein